MIGMNNVRKTNKILKPLKIEIASETTYPKTKPGYKFLN